LELKSEVKKVIVVKIGGSTLGEHDTTIQDLTELQNRGVAAIVVHGGGKLITDWLGKLGADTRFIRGKRVTDKPSLDVVVSVLAGLVNKEIVAAINRLGGRAIGISGVDGALIEGSIEDAELGYVGSIYRINTAPLAVMLEAGYIPVIAPIGLHRAGGNGNTVNTLNINADTVAGEIASVIKAEMLVFLTDVDGVRDEKGKLIPELSATQAEALVKAGVASGGMIPKVEACLRSLQGGAVAHIIDGRKAHALIELIDARCGGTIVRLEG
jgi:acetylglutamate kinase